MKLIIYVSMLSMVFLACKRQQLENGNGSSNLSAISIGKPAVDDGYYDSASIAIDCVSCEPSINGDIMVNYGIEMTEKMNYGDLMVSLQTYQYTEGSQIKIDLKFYKSVDGSDELVLDTCEGSAAGCKDELRTLAKSAAGKFEEVVKLVDLKSGGVVETVPESADLEIKPVLEDGNGDGAEEGEKESGDKESSGDGLEYEALTVADLDGSWAGPCEAAGDAWRRGILAFTGNDFTGTTKTYSDAGCETETNPGSPIPFTIDSVIAGIDAQGSTAFSGTVTFADFNTGELETTEDTFLIRIVGDNLYFVTLGKVETVSEDNAAELSEKLDGKSAYEKI